MTEVTNVKNRQLELDESEVSSAVRQSFAGIKQEVQGKLMVETEKEFLNQDKLTCKSCNSIAYH